MADRRRICFVTGTRAEFGLMRTTLRAITDHPSLELQIIATGMHLDPAHGDGLAAIRDAGWKVSSTVLWPADSGKNRTSHAMNTGTALCGLADAYAQLRTDIVLVVGDRVEAFAAASAAHLSGTILAHVHGGDRAAGQVDDALRHAITKLAHVHFPATRQSAARVRKLGEDAWRIHLAGAPGVDGIRETAARWEAFAPAFESLSRRRYALLVYHPVVADFGSERQNMFDLLDVTAAHFEKTVIIHPNNDPGSDGIRAALRQRVTNRQFLIREDVPREVFLGLMRDAAVLIGNSSSGIIEAASFGTPVLDVGTRQAGREHGANVHHVECSRTEIERAIKRLSEASRPRANNVYGNSGAGQRIADVLAEVQITDRLRRKLISY